VVGACVGSRQSDLMRASHPEKIDWSPYALIARREGKDPGIRVIGTMHRPTWENCWDVLQDDGIITSSENDGRRWVSL
jgi:hypothetical protein